MALLSEGAARGISCIRTVRRGIIRQTPMTASPEPPPNELQLLQQGRALFAIARAVLRDVDGAEDAVQDALVTALRRTEGQHAGWLTRIVQNLARRRLRDLVRRRQRHAGLPTPEPAPAADAVAAQIETHRLVAVAMQQVGEPYRSTLVLRFWHDLPPRAIARRLGIPVATVKSRLQRGLGELRQRLDATSGDRHRWIVALAPFAVPAVGATAAAGTGLTFAALLPLALMTMKTLLLLVGIGIGILLWPWLTARPDAVVRPDEPATGRVAAAAPVETAQQQVELARTRAKEAELRAAASPRCTVVGRIVGDDGLPVANAKLRLMHRETRPQVAEITAPTADDGTFAVDAPRHGQHLPFAFALAGAPGWAVREVLLDLGDAAKVRDDRVDLGTLVLERGVAVAGRILEADGAPLRQRAQLLVVDPGQNGSWSQLTRGRPVGHAEPGGEFALADRLAAGRTGKLVLVAIGASGLGWLDLEFAAGQTTLPRQTLSLLAGDAVRLRIVGEDGQPIAGASVQTTPHFLPIGLAPMWLGYRAYVVPRAEDLALLHRLSDTDGTVRFAALPRIDDARIRAANREHRPSGMLVTVEREGFVTNSLDVVPGHVGEVVVTLLRPRTFDLRATVQTRSGRPLRGVSIRGVSFDARRDSTTGDDGRCLIEAVPTGEAWLELSGETVPRQVLAVKQAGEGVVEHTFVVDERSAVTGRVVDDLGAPVADVRVLLGVRGGTYYPSQPEWTAADGAFSFPDATTEHDQLIITPPKPWTRWQLPTDLTLRQRDDVVIVLTRVRSPLLDLRLELVDGSSQGPVSPTEAELIRRSGELTIWSWEPTLSHGSAAFAALPPGRYRAIVRAEGGRCSVHDFELPATGTQHRERIALWPTGSVVCTVDPSALPAENLARMQGEGILLHLEGDGERSYMHAVDANGRPRQMTENTGLVTVGGEMTFRLDGVTAHVPRRLVVRHASLFGEAWVTAVPGTETQVTLRLVPFGTLAVEVPPSWSAGWLELALADGDTWRTVLEEQVAAPGPDDERRFRLRAATGERRWRMRFLPATGGESRSADGTITIRPGEASTVRPQ